MKVALAEDNAWGGGSKDLVLYMPKFREKALTFS